MVLTQAQRETAFQCSNVAVKRLHSAVRGRDADIVGIARIRRGCHGTADDARRGVNALAWRQIGGGVRQGKTVRIAGRQRQIHVSPITFAWS